VDAPAPKVESEDAQPAEEGQGWREACEVIAFLKERGAKIPLLRHVQAEGEWAALSSDVEGEVSPSG